MATAKKQTKQAAPKAIRSVVKAADGTTIPVSVIPIRRSGRPDFVLTTTYSVTSELTRDVSAHASRVEAEWTKPALKQPRLWGL